MNTDEKIALILVSVKVREKYAHRQADKHRAFDTNDYFYYRGQEDAFDEIVAMLESIVEGGGNEQESETPRV